MERSTNSIIRKKILEIKKEIDLLKSKYTCIEILEIINERVINEIYPQIDEFLKKYEEEKYVDVILINDYLDNIDKNKVKYFRISQDNIKEILEQTEI